MHGGFVWVDLLKGLLSVGDREAADLIINTIQKSELLLPENAS